MTRIPNCRPNTNTKVKKTLIGRNPYLGAIAGAPPTIEWKSLIGPLDKRLWLQMCADSNPIRGDPRARVKGGYLNWCRLDNGWGNPGAY
jgi:hypothetical protein